jgi:aspartate ammonia-lyase
MRTDKDSLGEVSVPDHALYSAGTTRGAENFNLVGKPVSAYPVFVGAMAKVKKSAVRANLRVGALEEDIAGAMVEACDEIIAGEHHENFIVALAEGSGGTSINMNFNEVIANRAGQILGDPLGRFSRVNPNDHANRSQSTNDVIPTAVKLACVIDSTRLLEEASLLAEAFKAKADQFRDVLRLGRTCMQAAQPMTYGQLFGGYAAGLARAVRQIEVARAGLCTVPMGGTAIGTGLGAAPGYGEVIAGELSDVFGFEIVSCADPFDGMQAADGFVRFSGEMKIFAESVAKIASDLVILGSGPNSGLGEILLPQVQPGSSIMAGKVNPVMCMLVQQIAFMVQGDDTTVSIAALSGQMEINHFEPVMARALFNSIESLKNGCRLFRTKCVADLDIDTERSYVNLAESAAMSSIFLSKLGYSRVTDLVKESISSKTPFLKTAIRQGLLTESEIQTALLAATKGISDTR